MATPSTTDRPHSNLTPGSAWPPGVIFLLAACLCTLTAQPVLAQSPDPVETSYRTILGELYPDEVAPFHSLYASLDAYDRMALARITGNLGAGERGMFAHLLTQTDQPTAIKTLRILSGLDDTQLAQTTAILQSRDYDSWETIPVLVRGESYANARAMLLGNGGTNGCTPYPPEELSSEEAQDLPPPPRQCSAAEAQFYIAFFAGGTGYVSKGVLAREGQVPWQAQFSLHGASTRAYYGASERQEQRQRFGRPLEDWEINHTCGAVYLGGQFVLTAAHCIGNLADNRFFRGRRIHLGSIKIDSRRNLFKIDKVFVHADYNNATLQHDIALIQLEKVPTGLDVVRSARLPRSPAQPSGRVPLLVSGWGYDRPARSSSDIFALDGGRQSPAQPSLLMGDMWVQKLSVCRNNRNFRRRQIDLYAGQICVGSPQGVDSCRGDSGGPLVDPESEVLIGIVSGSAGCGLTGTPSIFTDVGYYRDWIDRAMDEAKLRRSQRKYKFR